MEYVSQKNFGKVERREKCVLISHCHYYLIFYKISASEEHHPNVSTGCAHQVSHFHAEMVNVWTISMGV
jgi:hypothetical protein